MSNDVKFWLSRIALAAMLFVDASFISLTGQSAFVGDGHTKKWAIVSIVSIALSLPVAFYYYIAKENRWNSSSSSYSEVETLSAYLKQQEQEKKNPIDPAKPVSK